MAGGASLNGGHGPPYGTGKVAQGPPVGGWHPPYAIKGISTNDGVASP